MVDDYASDSTPPLKVAAPLEMAPNSSHFRMLCGAAIAYGLIEGGAKAAEIRVTQLASRILKPTKEGDDVVARREAFRQPRIVGEFLQKYSGSSLPKAEIARNVLEEMGVPKDKTDGVHNMIQVGARSVGFITEIKGKEYVDLIGTQELGDEVRGIEQELPAPQEGVPESGDEIVVAQAEPSELKHRKRRVFIAHGKNKSLVEPIKKLLNFGELEAVASTEKQTVSQPVPDKVMADLRGCGAAIIHIDAETTLIDKGANEHTVLNPNVLIEIGAAMALFGRRFILLVRQGVTLPSNLQGLYEVRYDGSTLDGPATIALLEAINDIKNHPLPGEHD